VPAVEPREAGQVDRGLAKGESLPRKEEEDSPDQTPRLLSEAPWRTTARQRPRRPGQALAWPFQVGHDGALPATARIEQARPSRANEVVEDHVGAISAALDAHDATVPPGARSPAAGRARRRAGPDYGAGTGSIDLAPRSRPAGSSTPEYTSSSRWRSGSSRFAGCTTARRPPPLGHWGGDLEASAHQRGPRGVDPERCTG